MPTQQENGKFDNVNCNYSFIIPASGIVRQCRRARLRAKKYEGVASSC